MSNAPEFLSISYEFEDGPGQLRCALAQGQLIFVGSDIARWLGHSRMGASRAANKWSCLSHVWGARRATCWGVVTVPAVHLLITYGREVKSAQKQQKLEEFNDLAKYCESRILASTFI